MSNADPFRIFITPKCLQKLNWYATEAQPTEIGGLAKLDIRDNNDVIVEDVHMFEQDASGGTFEIDVDKINEFTLAMVKAGKTDELEQWCSIVHSHPVGMGAQMSGVDVAAIKRYAAEQDAFSLIISASRNGDTQCEGDNILMHYCCNVRGAKILYPNMKVHTSTTHERLEFAEVVKDLILKSFGDLEEGDAKEIGGIVDSFMLNELPYITGSESRKMREDIRDEVRKLIKKKTYALTPYNGGGRYGSKSNYSSGGGHYLHGRNMNQPGVGTYSSPPVRSNQSAAWQSVYDVDTIDKKEAEQESHMRLVKLANGFDPDTGERISKKRAKRARRKLEIAAGASTGSIPNSADLDDGFLFEPQVGDSVRITSAAVDRLTDEHMDLEDFYELMTLLDSPDRIEAIKYSTNSNDRTYIVDGHELFKNEILPAENTYGSTYADDTKDKVNT